MAADDRMRAADRDREGTVEILRKAYAEGRLDHAELDERTDAALRAQTWGELRGLIADIPPPAPAGGLPPDELGRQEPPIRPGPPSARRPTSLNVALLVTALVGVVIGVAARDLVLVAVAVLVGSTAAIRRR